jgi:acyl carrier protein
MMDRRMLRQVLQELLENDLGKRFGALEDGALLREELGLDSVALVNLVVQIQDHFQVFLTNEELESVACVGDLLDLLQRKRGGLAQAG